MDYEKAFKEAYGRASLRFGTNVANELFLEYKESKEERIRRKLIEFFSDWSKTKSHCWGIRVTDIMDWLEKQDKTKEYTFKSLPRLLDMIEPTDRAKSYCQKLIDTLLTEGYDTDAKIVKECLKQMNGETVAMAVMDGQTITDKYEPKFKIGDWVVWDNKMSCYIDNIYQGKESLMYTIIDTNNIIRSCSVKIFDNNSHLWSIKDAKNGDVLATDDWVFIFEKLNTDGKPICYCHYDIELGFVIDVNTYISTGSYIRPATKEERDLLFQKMYEAGYTFDFESKELKKIEQKPIFDVEIPFGAKDSELQEATYLIPEGFHTEIKGDKVVIKKGKQKPAWTEEDEEVMSELLSFLLINTSDQWAKYGKWIKSLKQRIGG